MDVVALAAHLQALDDAALDVVVTDRGVPQQLASMFDLAEHLLLPDSIERALAARSRHELATLAAGRSTPRLEALMLAIDGAAIAEVQAAAAAAGIADTSAGSVHDPDVALAAQRAIDTALGVGELVHRVADEPLVLRSRGALPAADARALAAALEIDSEALDEYLALAHDAGLLVRRHGRMLATHDADAWLQAPLAERWRRLANTWLAHSRDAASVLRTADPALQFPLATPAVLERRATELRQARRLGLTDAGTPTPLADGTAADDADAGATGSVSRAAVAALESLVPPAIDRVYLQPDLSIVAPGPLSSGAEARLRTVAQLERSGVASQWRLTTRSVTRAIASGSSAEDVLAQLEELSLTPVPQPVSYLVRDAAGRFGALRVRALDGTEGGALAQVRSEDAGLIRTLAVDRALAPLAPRLSGPHRVLLRADAEQTLAILLDERYPAAREDDEGRLVTPLAERAASATPGPSPLVARLRGTGFAVGEAERAWLERQLQAAVRDRMPLRLTLEHGSEPVEVDLVPLAVANGRLRARDAAKDVERTLPLSAIARVAGLSAAAE